jgi:hypothetical protein
MQVLYTIPTLVIYNNSFALQQIPVNNQNKINKPKVYPSQLPYFKAHQNQVQQKKHIKYGVIFSQIFLSPALKQTHVLK